MNYVLYKWNPYDVICEMMDNKNLQTSLCQTKNMPAHWICDLMANVYGYKIDPQLSSSIFQGSHILWKSFYCRHILTKSSHTPSSTLFLFPLLSLSLFSGLLRPEEEPSRSGLCCAHSLGKRAGHFRHYRYF